MQTVKVDGTTYTLKFDKCPIQWAKLARKAWKPKKPKDLRKFPVRSDLSTAEKALFLINTYLLENELCKR